MSARREADLGSSAQRDRRRRILDSAIVLASEGGFDAVQMRGVAERADVALGTLYRYFPSKIHLLVCALARELEQAHSSLQRKPAPGDTAPDRVLHVLARTTRSLQRDPNLTGALIRAFMFADATVASDIEGVTSSVLGMLLQAIKAPSPVAAAEEPTEEQTAIARVIGDVWFASLVQWVTGRASAADVSRSLDVAVRLLLR